VETYLAKQKNTDNYPGWASLPAGTEILVKLNLYRP
jgi:hypothetical protein